jgi:hypothetical protein
MYRDTDNHACDNNESCVYEMTQKMSWAIGERVSRDAANKRNDHIAVEHDIESRRAR